MSGKTQYPSWVDPRAIYGVPKTGQTYKKVPVLDWSFVLPKRMQRYRLFRDDVMIGDNLTEAEADALLAVLKD